MFRKKISFDALLVISEILAITFTFYFSYILFVLILDWLFSIPFSFQQIINYSLFHFSTKMGIISILGELFGGISSSFLFVYLEGRFRKALDFVSTTFIFHIIIISYFCMFPRSFCWWFCTILSFIVSTFFAGKISMNYEMQDINLEAVLPAAFKNANN